jgi:predicted RNase H-like nuclease
MKVVGVDGCKGGWVAMVWQVELGKIEPEIHQTLAGLIECHVDAGAIGIDIPIGLSSTGTRQCDIEARRNLGPGRSSSVFPPPLYEILDAPTFAEAQIRSVAQIGRGTSQQSFAIFPRIAEAITTITPEMQDRVFEVHPEVSFWALAKRPMVYAKRNQLGYDERRRLLQEETGIELRSRKEAFGWARPAKPDDLLDAFVAAWTAKRVVEGGEGRFPGAVELGTHGLRMEMVY